MSTYLTQPALHTDSVQRLYYHYPQEYSWAALSLVEEITGKAPPPAESLQPHPPTVHIEGTVAGVKLLQHPLQDKLPLNEKLEYGMYVVIAESSN